MNRNFRIIKIDGIKGLLTAVFVICCLIAGFLSFPGWVCMHIWNFTAGYFTQLPNMNMLHGIMLWAILALSFYALNKGNFSVSFGSSMPMPGNEERIKEILRKIQEENVSILKNDINTNDISKNEENVVNTDSNESSEDKSIR